MESEENRSTRAGEQWSGSVHNGGLYGTLLVYVPSLDTALFRPFRYTFFFYGSFTVVDVVDKLKRVTVARDFHTLRLYFFDYIAIHVFLSGALVLFERLSFCQLFGHPSSFLATVSKKLD